jgi:hypothetical protein
MTRARIVALVTLVIYALSACSPGDVNRWIYGGNQGYHVDAKPVADDGGGSMFWAAIKCSGEGFWREGPHVNVNNAPNTGNGQYISEVICPFGRIIEGTNVGRGQS